jgi:hypothetical protein
MANPFDPDWLIYHDSHGSPENEKRQRMPYHVTVFPDGTVNYRDPGNPYGYRAPHVFDLNPKALGLAYSGPVGGMPTPEGMRSLQQEYEKIQARFPGLPGMGHGEAWEEHKKDPSKLARPSRDGRSIEEASWRGSVGDMSNVPASGLRPLGLLPPSGEQAPPDVGPVVAGAAPRPYASAPRPSTPSTASPPPSPRMALGGPKPMPYDARTGEYVSPEVWKSRMGMGQDLLNAPIRGGKYGGIASGLEGLFGGLFTGWGQRGAQGNQDMQQRVLQEAANAQDPQTMARMLMGVPSLAPQGLSMLSQAMDPNRALDLKAKQRALAHAEETDPYTLAKIKEEVEAAKTKRELDDLIMRRLVPQGAAPAPTATPAPNATPPPTPRFDPRAGQTPMPGINVAPVDQRSSLGEGVMPGGVTPAQFAPQAGGAAPAQKQQPPAAAEPDMIVTPFGRMPREQARELGGLLMLRGKPDAGKALIDAAGAERFGKEGGNLLDKKTIDATNHISRLRSVEQAFDPKFLQIPQRLGFAWTSLKAKVSSLTPEQAKPLAEFAEFRRASVENMSRLLNELSGAAVSPQEYERIRNTQPDAGTGIFDGDDPVTFAAKMKGVVRDQKRAIARYNHLRLHGPQGKNPWDVMGLDEIDKVMDRRGAELNQELRQANPQANPAVIQKEVDAKLAKEFGLAI